MINGTTSAFFEKSNVSVFQHMWAVMQKSSSEVFFTTNDEGVGKVRNSKGKYAFFIEYVLVSCRLGHETNESVFEC